MARGAIWVLAVVVGVTGSPAAAVDWSIGGFFSQRGEARTTEDDDEAPLRAVTDVGAAITAQTPTTEWRFAPGARVTLSDEGAETDRLLPRLNASVRHSGARRMINGSLSAVPQFLDDAQFDDSGRVDAEVLQFTVNGRLGGSYAVGPRDTLQFGVFGRLRDFTEDVESLTPTLSYGADGGWRRLLTPVTGGGVQVQYTIFTADSETSPDGQSVSVQAQVDHRPTPRTQLDAGFGPSVTFRDATATSDADTQIGVVGNFDIRHDTPDTRYAASVAQIVDQSSEGDLEDRTVFSVSVSHSVNSVERIGLSSSLNLQTGLFGAEEDRTSFSISPFYTLEMTPDWSLNIGYRLRFSETESESSELRNTVFLSVSRGLSLLP